MRIRNQLFHDLGIIVIFINQLRKKVGATKYEDPDTTPGGDAMKFFAHQRMAFFQKKQITEGKLERKIWLGNEVSVRLKKNKVSVALNKQYLPILLDCMQVCDKKRLSSKQLLDKYANILLGN